MGEAEGEGAPPMSQTSTFQSGGSVSVFTMKPVVGATGAEAVRSAARCKTEVLPAPSKPRQRTLASYHTTAHARTTALTMRQQMCGSVAALTRLGLEPAAEDLVQRDLDRGVDHERAPLHHGSPVSRVVRGAGQPRENAKLATGGSSGLKAVTNTGKGPCLPSHGQGQVRVYGVEERLDPEDGDALQVEADEERLPGWG